jgi:Spy/CpxP family protein refolding chaperone
MKRIDRNYKLLVAIIILLGLSLGVMAQPHRRGPMPHHRPMIFQPGLPFLDLTDEQKAQIKDIHLAHVKDVQPLKDEVKINRAKIDALLKNDEPDMKQIVSLVEANGKFLTQVQVKSIEQRINIRSLLTEEQKIIFDAHSERMGKRRAMIQHHRQRMTADKSRF